jgi:hypothetical protein
VSYSPRSIFRSANCRGPEWVCGMGHPLERDMNQLQYQFVTHFGCMGHSGDSVSGIKSYLMYLSLYSQVRS